MTQPPHSPPDQTDRDRTNRDQIPTEGRPGVGTPDVVAGIAAVAWPGLGHIVRGHRSRGGLAMLGVLGLFLYGLFIGGIDAVDSKEDRIWFVGTAMVGPLAWGTDWAHQNLFKAADPNSGRVRTGRPGEVRDAAGGTPVWRAATPDELAAGAGPPNAKGLGRLNEIAMLAVVLAGMLNFIVFLDALLPGRGATKGGAT
jgi:hypothetical protein